MATACVTEQGGEHLPEREKKPRGTEEHAWEWPKASHLAVTA